MSNKCDFDIIRFFIKPRYNNRYQAIDKKKKQVNGGRSAVK